MLATSSSQAVHDRPTAPGAVKPARLVSVDVLRGVTVALMILVNTAGDGQVSYGQLRHSAWNGCTLTDLVFPTFLFLMGVAMSVGRPGEAARAPGRLRRLRKASRRSLILFALGLGLNLLPWFQWSTLRYCGVLQRIAVTFWLASLATFFLNEAGLLAVTTLLLTGYWGLLTLVPVPGFERTGLQLGILNPVANLASAIDRILIAPAHLYHHTFYDPEGVLSTLPALASVLCGYLAGAQLRRSRTQLSFGAGLARMALCGTALALLALLWSLVFPMNKRLWTSSYALWAAGLDIVLLAGLSFLLDLPDAGDGQQRRSYALAPWKAFGSNALIAYIFSEVLAIVIGTIHVSGGLTVQRWSFLLLPAWLGSPALRSLEWSIAFTAVCFVPIYILYRRRILIKL